MRVRALSPALGAEITDLDLSEPMSAESYQAVSRALFDRGVIVAKRQRLTPNEFLAFGERFGSIQAHPHLPQHPDCQKVSIVATGLIGVESPQPAKEGQRDADWRIELNGWHSDLIYQKEAALATAILSQEVPKSGGELLFLSSYASYDALPDNLKKEIDGRTGTFCFGGRRAYKVASTEKRSEIAVVEHPAVLTHPETGRKALSLNPQHSLGLAGMPQEGADAILDNIFDHHLLRPKWEYHHSWESGDLVMWDNRCVLHSGMPGYAPEIRRPVWRITVMSN